MLGRVNNRTIVIVGLVVSLLVVIPLIYVWWASTQTSAVTFYHEEPVNGTSGLVILDVNLEAGLVSIQFEDNTNLLYRMEFTTPREVFDRYGEPVPTFVANEIDLTYYDTDVRITLGTGVHYGIEVATNIDMTELNISSMAFVEYVDIDMGNGTILFMLFDGVNVIGDMPVNLDIFLGDIIVNATIASDIGGSFEGVAASGTVNIIAYDHWSESGPTCVTSNYAIAAKTITISATIGDVGDIDAFFNKPFPP